MDVETFKKSIDGAEAPAEISVHLLSLWYDARGDWNRAHQVVDSLDDNTSCWVHAYLHRKEGDIGNADYWYRRAHKIRPSVSLPEEWEMIVKELL